MACAAYVWRVLVHARRWAHSRRNYVNAEESNPAGVAKALSLAGANYVHEQRIRKKNLDGPAIGSSSERTRVLSGSKWS